MRVYGTMGKPMRLYGIMGRAMTLYDTMAAGGNETIVP